MSQEYVDGIIALSKLNPNKFTIIEKLALDRIENKAHESMSWIDVSIRRSPKKDTVKLQEVRKYYSYVVSSCERMSSSFLLKPVKGWVIQLDRKRITKNMLAAQAILDKYSIN